MTNVRVIKPALAALVAAAACVGGLAFSSAQPAQADTYSDLINAQHQHAASYSARPNSSSSWPVPARNWRIRYLSWTI